MMSSTEDFGLTRRLPHWLVVRAAPWAPQWRAAACIIVVLHTAMFIGYPRSMLHWYDRLHWALGTMASGAIIYAWWPVSWRFGGRK